MLPKFKISYLWFPFLWLGYLSHSLFIIFIIFIMLMFHELAHLLVARYFNYKISNIILYPFGIGAQIESIGWGNVYHELLILISGPTMHLIYPFCFLLCKQTNIISPNFYNYLIHLNFSILIFNLLPIYPLDGGRILSSLFHFIMPFHLAQKCTLFFSLFHLCFIFLYFITFNISSIIVMLFLLIQIIIAYHQRNYTRRQFYFYRKYHPVSYKIYAHPYQDIYRQRYNLIKCRNVWMKEEDWLDYYLGDFVKIDPQHFTIL
ncbi:MAG: site-2 protease family protein [Erysipelotrichaceae bacterium]